MCVGVGGGREREREGKGEREKGRKGENETVSARGKTFICTQCTDTPHRASQYARHSLARSAHSSQICGEWKSAKKPQEVLELESRLASYVSLSGQENPFPASRLYNGRPEHKHTSINSDKNSTRQVRPNPRPPGKGITKLMGLIRWPIRVGGVR